MGVWGVFGARLLTTMWIAILIMTMVPMLATLRFTRMSTLMLVMIRRITIVMTWESNEGPTTEPGAYPNAVTRVHSYCGRAHVLRIALSRLRIVCAGYAQCRGSAARFSPPSGAAASCAVLVGADLLRVWKSVEQHCCVPCFAALPRCDGMSLATEDEPHECPESV